MAWADNGCRSAGLTAATRAAAWLGQSTSKAQRIESSGQYIQNPARFRDCVNAHVAGMDQNESTDYLLIPIAGLVGPRNLAGAGAAPGRRRRGAKVTDCACR